jgi:glycosyltransferase involved in cell wall biosynthesis
MRIAIDCRGRAGVGRVVSNIAIGVAPRVDHLVLLGDPEQIRTWGDFSGNVEIVPFMSPVYGWQEQVRFPVSRIRFCNILHVPHFNVPFRPLKCPLVCTVNDTAHLAGILPMSVLQKAAAQIYYRYAVHRAVHIITLSEFSRQEICNRLKVPRDRITVIHPGVDTRVFYARRRESVQEVLSTHHISEPYLLVLGSIRTHKNVGRILQAFVLLKNRDKIPHHLVIVGQRGGFRIDTRLPEIPPHIARDVIFTGTLDDEKIAALYSGAEAFIFASIYEGFGLPPLEAMACGTPVAVSNAASMPEAVGSAGAYFNPFDIEDIARVVLDLIGSPEKRRRMSQQGREWALRSTWEHAIEEHLRVYETYAR